MRNWNDFDKFGYLNNEYLPYIGQGETMATQIVTAVNKLVYKYYNDGDVYDNTYHLSGWLNDVSRQANWLYEHVPKTRKILDRIEECYTYDAYEDILWDLANATLNDEYLSIMNDVDMVGDIYTCDGKFEVILYAD